MRGKDDALLTRNTVPGESVYNEKRVTVEVSNLKIMKLVWSDFCSLATTKTNDSL